MAGLLLFGVCANCLAITASGAEGQGGAPQLESLQEEELAEVVGQGGTGDVPERRHQADESPRTRSKVQMVSTTA